MDKTLRDDALSAVARQGFSSLQEALRVFLTKVAYDKWQISFDWPATVLTKKNVRRYDQMDKDVRTGKVKLNTTYDVDELMKQLHNSSKNGHSKAS